VIRRLGWGEDVVRQGGTAYLLLQGQELLSDRERRVPGFSFQEPMNGGLGTPDQAGNLRL